MSDIRATLMEYAKKAGLALHPDNVGAAREGIAKNFLSESLPQTANFLTGEVFNSSDERSGQIDLIVYPTSCPRLNLHGDVHLVFSDHCLAALEIKSTLTTASWDTNSHLKTALESCLKLKRLGRMHPIQGSLVGSPVALTTTPFLVCAYEGPTRETLEEKLLEYQKINSIEDEMMPDMVTVLSRRYLLAQNNGWLFRAPPEHKWIAFYDNDAVLIGMYAYLLKLIEAYAYNPKSTALSSYLSDLREN